jgi:tetratricopeptide (TPR) repeat protein
MIDAAIKLTSDPSDMLVIRGHILLECGEEDEAEKSFMKALNMSDDSPSIMLRIIVSLYDNRYVNSCYEMFLDFFEAVDDHHPDFNKGYAYMALCCWDLRKKDEFMEYLQKSVERNPREAKLVLGFLFPETMEPSEYVQYMERELNN